jgi:hypothetical protein
MGNGMKKITLLSVNVDISIYKFITIYNNIVSSLRLKTLKHGML